MYYEKYSKFCSMEEDADAAAPTFVGRFNSATGTIEWVAETDHDYASELAASGYGDMVSSSARSTHSCPVQ